MRRKIENIITNLNNKKKSANSEEATKQGIILPFLDALGYDVWNTNEVIPELGVKSRRSENVDYGIKVDGKPIMIVECKQWRENLKDHWAQLDGYFRYSDGFRIGILTNGIHYQFFSDFEEPNKMDKSPFLDFNLELFYEHYFKDLDYFKKNKFDINTIENQFGLKSKIINELKNPSENFVKIFFPNRRKKFIQEKRTKIKKIVNEIFIRKTEKPVKLSSGGSNEKGDTNLFPTNIIEITEVSPTPPNKRSKIRVSFPNGEVIQGNNVTDTFVKAIEKIGLDRVQNIGIIRGGINIVSEDKHSTLSQKYLPDKQAYIFTNLSTKDKLTILNEIANSLNT